MSKTPEQISFNMKRIRCKDTIIEITLRKLLWKNGYRYRKNVKKIMGCLDIAFISHKIAIFCDSEFWHGYNWKERKKDFKSNRDFWIPKIEKNMTRDKFVNDELKKQGWIVLRFSEKEIKNNPTACLEIIGNAFKEREK